MASRATAQKATDSQVPGPRAEARPGRTQTVDKSRLFLVNNLLQSPICASNQEGRHALRRQTTNLAPPTQPPREVEPKGPWEGAGQVKTPRAVASRVRRGAGRTKPTARGVGGYLGLPHRRLNVRRRFGPKS